ncbi:hypothetical protein [Methanobacterium aggregans]|uniref:hypothetical protein n=1 Tax=Methanobacterium aggregans TaxID=1615586 RepID=UPI001AE4370B|nr:hypothetical protein [Methanobacterium aggregans]MBP2045293.1 hypothetical protein [Methanobacterium aggregans]
MLKCIDSQLLGKTKPFATDIILKFEDNNVSEYKYRFINPKLDDYILKLPTGWKMISDTQYNKVTGSLLISIIITIPDNLVPKGNLLDSVQIFADHIKGFREFYERLKHQFDMINDLTE